MVINSLSSETCRQCFILHLYLAVYVLNSNKTAAGFPLAPTAAAEGGDGARLSPAPAPTDRSFNSTLAACARGISNGDREGFQRALGVVEAMRAGDGDAPSPTIVTYREMVNVCGR